MPLFYPCKCDGSIKYVHKDCLLEWLRVAGNNNKCEICGEKCLFSKIYAENASLSPFDLWEILLPKLKSFFYTIFKLLINLSECIVLIFAFAWWGLLCIEVVNAPGRIYELVYSVHTQLAIRLPTLLFVFPLMIINDLTFTYFLYCYGTLNWKHVIPPVIVQPTNDDEPPQGMQDVVQPPPPLLLIIRNLPALCRLTVSSFVLPSAIIIGCAALTAANHSGYSNVEAIIVSAAFIRRILPPGFFHLSDSLTQAFFGYSIIMTVMSLAFVYSNISTLLHICRAIFNILLFLVLICYTLPASLACFIDMSTWKLRNTTFTERCNECLETEISRCVFKYWVIGVVCFVNVFPVLKRIRLLLKPNIRPPSIHDMMVENFSTMTIIETFLIYICLSIVSVTLLFILPLHIAHIFWPSPIYPPDYFLPDTFMQMVLEVYLFTIISKTCNFGMDFIYYVEVFVIKLCELLRIEEQLIDDDLYSMMLVIKKVQISSATLRLQNTQAFEAQFSRLTDLYIVKESIANLCATYSQLNVDVADIVTDDSLSAEVDHEHLLHAKIDQKRLLSMCIAHTITSMKFDLTLLLDELKHLRTNRANDFALNIRQNQVSFNGLINNADMHLYLNQAASACLKALDKDIIINKDNMDFLNEMDSHCRFEDPENLMPIYSPKLLNCFFAQFHHHNISFPLENVDDSMFHSDSEGNIEANSIECSVVGNVNSIEDEVKNTLNHMDDMMIGNPESKLHFKISQMIFILISRDGDKTSDRTFDGREKTLALLAGADVALLAKFNELSERADDITNISGRLSLVPLVWRCSLFVGICCICLTSISTILVNVPTLIGRCFFNLVGLRNMFSSVHFFLGLGICQQSAVFISSFAKKQVIAAVVVLANTLSSCILLILKLFLFFLVTSFVVYLVDLFTSLFVSPLFTGVAENVTPILSAPFQHDQVTVFLMGYALFDPQWSRNLNRVIEMDVYRIDFQFFFCYIICPPALLVIDCLTFPFALGKLATLTVEVYGTKSLIMRYSFLSYFIFGICCLGFGCIWRKLSIFFEKVKDERYLLAIDLSNRMENCSS